MKINSIDQSSSSVAGVQSTRQSYAGNANSPTKNDVPSSSNVNISAAAQSANASSSTVGAGASASVPLPPGVENMLKDMVDNPQQWMDYVKGYGSSHSAAMSISQFLASKDTITAGQLKLKDVLNSSLAQGKSPAQIMVDVLSHELSLPQSYWDAMNAGGSHPSPQELTTAKLSFLQSYMASHGRSQ